MLSGLEKDSIEKRLCEKEGVGRRPAFPSFKQVLGRRPADFPSFRQILGRRPADFPSFRQVLGSLIAILRNSFGKRRVDLDGEASGAESPSIYFIGKEGGSRRALRALFRRRCRSSAEGGRPSSGRPPIRLLPSQGSTPSTLFHNMKTGSHH